MTPLLYAKWGGIAALAIALFGGGFYFGGLPGEAKAAAAQTALETDHADMAQATTSALLAQRSQMAAQAAADHATEKTHADDLAKIASTPPRTSPVIVYVSAPSPVRVDPVPGAEAEAGGVTADPKAGGADPGRGVNIRAALNALEVKYETVLADYRQLDAEWPK